VKNGNSQKNMHIISSQGPEITGHLDIRHSQKLRNKISAMLEYSQFLNILITLEVFKYINLSQVEQGQV
jgi:hypothetical protein